MADEPGSVEASGAATPVREGRRIASLDVLRGFAVLGILAMNAAAFAFPTDDFFNPTIGGFDGINRVVWIVNHFIFDLKMMSIFSMLFGAGMILMSGREQGAGRSSAGLHYRRMAWLLVFGLIHSYFLWFGDILVSYALCGMIVYPLRGLRPALLIALSAVVMGVALVVSGVAGGSMLFMRAQAEQAELALAEGREPTELQAEMLSTWAEIGPTMMPTPESIDDEIRAYRGTFAKVFVVRAKSTIQMQTTMFAMWGLWRVSGLMLLGMGLMKLWMFAAQWPARRYALVALLGYGLGWPLVFLGWQRTEASGFDFLQTFAINWHFNYIGSVLVALAHVSMVMLWCRSGAAAGAQRTLAAVGRMAFTNYIAQSLIFTTLFYGYGFGLFASIERWQLALLVVGTWVLQLAWSPWWLARFRYGPLEWLWRSLAYKGIEPIGRDQTVA